MRRAFVLAVVLIGVFITVPQNAFAQGAAPAEASQTGVVLVKLSPPIHPGTARMTAISGEVKIQLAIRKDGSIESASLFSGPLILASAALASAKLSQFECRECTEAVTAYQLAYTFELTDDGDCCTAYSRTPEVVQSQGHITIISAKECICDSRTEISRVAVRSAKCLYLWRCVHR
jgi:hypothetical protein